MFNSFSFRLLGMIFFIMFSPLLKGSDVIDDLGFSYSKKQKGNIVFQYKDKEKLQRHYNDLKKWTELVTNTPILDEAKIKEKILYIPLNKVGRGKFSTVYNVDMTSVLPPSIKEWNVCFQPVCSNGPNCWNASLTTSNMLQSFFYITDGLFSQALNSSLCKEVPTTENLQAGDIIAIRNQYGESISESHGAIYLDHDFAFTKNGYSRMSNYIFSSPAHVFKTYGIYKEKCERQPIQSPDSDCDTFANYYRCTQAPLSSLFKFYQNEFNELNKISIEVGKSALKGNAINHSSVQERIEFLEKKVGELYAFVIEKEDNAQMTFEFNLFSEMTSSLKESLNMIY